MAEIKTEEIFIGSVPVAVYGEDTGRAFLFVHGQGGNKDEAERFAKIAQGFGYQVFGVDLPEHNGRRDGARLLPWVVVPELTAVMRYIKSRAKSVSVRANSIGAWFFLLAFAGEDIEKHLLVSPLLDMENMIGGMIRTAGVSEKQLKEKKEIGDLSWEYLCWVRKNPVRMPGGKISILYAENDEVIPRHTVDAFAGKSGGTLCVMDGGEHWFHTPEQIAFMEQWEKERLI